MDYWRGWNLRLQKNCIYIEYVRPRNNAETSKAMREAVTKAVERRVPGCNTSYSGGWTDKNTGWAFSGRKMELLALESYGNLENMGIF
jgi:hypothetical protein